jgi:Ras-related protein Rab-7A
METRGRSGTTGSKAVVAKCFIKIVAIGDSGVGKTSLIQMFENAKFTESFKPTIGADFSNKEIRVSTGSLVTLQIWDTAGQERY